MEETTTLRIATPNDWLDYKNIRLEAITGSDGENFIANTTEERQKTDIQWKDELSNPNMLVVLAWKGSQVIGISRAEKNQMETTSGMQDLLTSKRISVCL